LVCGGKVYDLASRPTVSARIEKILAPMLGEAK